MPLTKDRGVRLCLQSFNLHPTSFPRTILNKPTLNSTRSNQPPKPSIETLLPIATNQTTRKMSRRALLSVPRAISASVQGSVRPTLASRTPLLRPVITQPTQRRSYHEKVLDHYSNPRNVGSMDKNADDVGTGESKFAVNLLSPKFAPRTIRPSEPATTIADAFPGLVGAPACGDVMKLQIKVDPDTQKISEVKFKTFGCGSAIASSSYLTELVRGMTLEQAGKVRNTEIAKELCLPPVKLHCSMLAEDAIKSAISKSSTDLSLFNMLT